MAGGRHATLKVRRAQTSKARPAMTALRKADIIGVRNLFDAYMYGFFLLLLLGACSQLNS